MKILNKNLLKVLLFIFIFSGFALSVSHSVSAIEYHPLAPLPGIGDQVLSGESTTVSPDLDEYLLAMFKILIGLSALFAVIMITLGGAEMVSSGDSVSRYEKGKDRIKNALIGLFLAAGSWLILNSIDSRILEFNLNISSTNNEAIENGQNGDPSIAGKVVKARFCLPSENAVVTQTKPQEIITEFPYQTPQDLPRAFNNCLSKPPALNTIIPPSSMCPSGTYKESISCVREDLIRPAPQIAYWSKVITCNPRVGFESREIGSPQRYEYQVGDNNARVQAMDACTNADPTVRQDAPPDHCGSEAESETIRCIDSQSQ